MRKYILILMVLLCGIAFSTPVDSLPVLPKTNVDIPWTELRALIELSMASTKVVEDPPVDYIISSADYDAKVSNGVLSGDIDLDIRVISEGYVIIPLFDNDIPLDSPRLDRKIAPIVPRNNKHTLVLQGPGEFNFTTGFVKEMAEHVTNFQINIPKTSSGKFTIRIPGKNLDIKLNPASISNTYTSGNNTVCEAYLSSTDYLFCEWVQAIPEKEKEELEPLYYSEIRTLFSVGEGIIKGSTELVYNVIQGQVDALRFAVPGDVRILDVNGGNLRDWKMEESGKDKEITVYLKFPAEGNINLNCSFEKNMKAVSAQVKLPILASMGAEREKGYIGIQAITNVEINLVEDALKTATRIDRSELPRNLWHRANHPIVLAFKYLETPYSIVLDVEKHQDLPVKVATADNAEFVALLTRDGNYIVRGTYNVRNNLKQFMAMQFPEDAELWSLFVNGNPAKPGKGEDNTVLIPMEKSSESENSKAFPVEIIYFLKNKRFKSFGSRKVELPRVDIPVSVINLSLYLPYGYDYTGFGGNMEEGWSYSGYHKSEGIAAGSAAPAPARKSRQMDEMLQSQVAMEAEMEEAVQTFSSTEKGVFPVRISVPQIGNLHRFQKLIVPEDEDAPFPHVKVRYAKREIKRFLVFVVVLLSILAFLYFAKRINWLMIAATKKEKHLLSKFIKIIIIGLVEIIVLSWIARAFAVGVSAISIPWITGSIILVVYIIVKYLIMHWVEKSRARRILKKAEKKVAQKSDDGQQE